MMLILKKSFSFMLTMISIAYCHASESTQDINLLKEEKKQNILELIRFTAVHPDVLEIMVPNIANHFIESFSKDVSLQEVVAAVKNHLLSDAFLEPFIQPYDEAFSNDEIIKLVKFYKSDESKKMTKLGPQVGAPIFAAFGPAIREVLSTFPDKETKEPYKNEVIGVTKLNYQEEISQSELPVVLDVYSVLCSPCKAMEPIVANLSETLQGKVKFGKLSVDEELDLCRELKIQAMPTFLFIKDGKIVDRHVGAMSKEDMTKKIERQLLN